MLSIEDLRKELHAVLEISELSGSQDREGLKSFLVDDNLAYALAMAGEKVKSSPFIVYGSQTIRVLTTTYCLITY